MISGKSSVVTQSFANTLSLRFFDAMTSKRPYRDELPIDVVKEEFRKFSGTQFDPDLTKVFLDILENDYNEIIRIQSMYY